MSVGDRAQMRHDARYEMMRRQRRVHGAVNHRDVLNRSREFVFSCQVEPSCQTQFDAPSALHAERTPFVLFQARAGNRAFHMRY